LSDKVNANVGDNHDGHDDQGALEELAPFVDAPDIEEGNEASSELDHHKMYRTADKWGNKEQE